MKQKDRKLYILGGDLACFCQQCLIWSVLIGAPACKRRSFNKQEPIKYLAYKIESVISQRLLIIFLIVKYSTLLINKSSWAVYGSK